MFFAVTYDSTEATDNVDFYIGTDSSAVSLVSTGTIGNAWDGFGSSADISWGNRHAANNGGAFINPFDGQMDDLRLYGAITGSRGALTLEQLEDVRQSAIPEPGTLGLNLLGAALLAVRRR
ncbi:MAG: PEP-CTERM sorting domain-containing protein [Planctomycetota bacterium]